jgi:beta-glucosidase/6-phospho-beta-glucosidase/beta-galactosidase
MSERPDEGIFPTFFLAGFECSTFEWKDGRRHDFVALTGHDRHLGQDYERAMELGIGTVREGIRWPMVERSRGDYDWSTVEPVIDAAGSNNIAVIWDLCHYGFPDAFDPFHQDASKHFADYCRAATELVTGRLRTPAYFTPVNEITFFAGAGTDMAWMYPFAKGRYAEFKRALCAMAIAGCRAIREVAPEARMVHVDPIIYEVPADHTPDLERITRENTREKAFEAWDILAGRKYPELGGSSEILDIVGVNIYSYCQAQVNADGSRQALGPRDPRRMPLNELLALAWNRYKHPMIIGETSGYGETRAEWIRMVMEESLIAINDGVDLQGVCLFPCVDMPDWQSGKWAQIGIYDIKETEEFRRIPCDPYIDEIRRWQQILDRPDTLKAEHLKDHKLQLSDVRQKAKEWEDRLKQREEAEDETFRRAAA